METVSVTIMSLSLPFVARAASVKYFNKILTGRESIYITFLLSNYFNIPCTAMCITYSENDISNNTSDSNKLLKNVSDKIINTAFSIF